MGHKNNAEIAALVAFLNEPRTTLSETEVKAGEMPSQKKLEELNQTAISEEIERAIGNFQNVMVPAPGLSASDLQLLRSRVNASIESCLTFPVIEELTKTGAKVRHLPNLHLLELGVRHSMESRGRQLPKDWRLSSLALNNLVCRIHWLRIVISGAEHGWLTRIRRCSYEPCSRWFERHNPKMKFHSSKCKGRAFRKENPDAERQKHNRYMWKDRMFDAVKDSPLRAGVLAALGNGDPQLRGGVQWAISWLFTNHPRKMKGLHPKRIEYAVVAALMNKKYRRQDLLAVEIIRNVVQSAAKQKISAKKVPAKVFAKEN